MYNDITLKTKMGLACKRKVCVDQITSLVMGNIRKDCVMGILKDNAVFRKRKCSFRNQELKMVIIFTLQL